MSGHQPAPQVYRGVHGFDLTTSGHLLNPERTFQVVSALNAAQADPSADIGVELYPTRSTPLARLDAGQVLAWQGRYGARVRRVHLEFTYDRAETRYIVRQADRAKSLYVRVRLRALFTLFSDALAGRGARLAAALGVGANVHSSVLGAMRSKGTFAAILGGLPFVLAENNIQTECLYVNGPLAYDPRTIVRELVGTSNITGLLLGIDHLLDQRSAKGIDPLALLDEPEIQRWTQVIHLAGHAHSAIRPGDAMIERLVRKLACTPFVHPVRLAFDYSPFALLGRSRRDEVQLFRSTIGWIRGVQEQR